MGMELSISAGTGITLANNAANRKIVEDQVKQNYSDIDWVNDLDGSDDIFHLGAIGQVYIDTVGDFICGSAEENTWLVILDADSVVSMYGTDYASAAKSPISLVEAEDVSDEFKNFVGQLSSKLPQKLVIRPLICSTV